MSRILKVIESYIGIFFILTIALLLTFDSIRFSYLAFSLLVNVYLVYRVRRFTVLKRSLVALVLGRFILMLHDFVFIGLNFIDKLQVHSIHTTASYVVFLIANLFYTLSIAGYFIEMTRRWNKFQLIIDVAFFVYGALFSLYVFFFKNVVTKLSFWSNDMLIILLLISGSTIFALLFIMIFKDDSIRKSTFKQLFVIGYFVNFIADTIFIFDYYLGMGGQLLTLRYAMICTTLFTFMLGIKSVSGNIRDELLSNEEIDAAKVSFNRYYLLSLAVAAPIIIYMFAKKRLIELTYFLIVGLLYFSVSIIHQKTLVSDELIVRENKVRKQLEDMVQQKKRQLEYANTVLYLTSEMDNLTKLNNRDFFFRYLSDLMADPNIEFSIFYLDLDNFKIINDLHGHQIGDKVLVEIAKRFSDYSMSDFVVSRMGGDEFSLIYNRVDEASLQEASKNIIEHITRPIEVNELSFKVGVSIGVARFPQDAKTVDDLLKYSDAAMYHAKSVETSEKYHLYSHDLFLQLDRKNRIELLLRSADINSAFQLHYQPIFDSKNCAVIGCEALLRWFHLTEGSISPNDFIPIAEEIGLIYDLSKWVVEQVVNQIFEWQQKYDFDLRIAINLSPKLFVDERFLNHVQTILSSTPIKPQSLIFEITEHSAMMPSSFVKNALIALSDMGVAISIDDFGTGYSSLSYIKRFKVDSLKIAQPLIDKIEYNKDNYIIVKSIILMARALNLTTVAEGVEYGAQLEILKQLGCDFIQGFICSGALPKDQFEQNFFENLEVN